MNTELIFALICGALLGAGALAGKLGLTDRLPLILYVSAYVFGGWFTTKEAISNIRQKRFEIDSLMLLAAAGVGICSSVIPYVCDQLAMARLPRASFALMLCLLPVVATIIGAVVLRQIPTFADMLGIALVVLGVAMHRPATP